MLGSEKVKIQVHNAESYFKLIKLLEESKTEFYTFKPKSARNFKVIIKNIHHSFDTSGITAAFVEHGHSEIEPKPINKKVYTISSLLHCHVIIEPPRPKNANTSIRKLPAVWSHKIVLLQEI